MPVFLLPKEIKKLDKQKSKTKDAKIYLHTFSFCVLTLSCISFTMGLFLMEMITEAMQALFKKSTIGIKTEKALKMKAGTYNRKKVWEIIQLGFKVENEI